MSALDSFRKETREWLEAHCPSGLRSPRDGDKPPAWGSPEWSKQAESWKEKVAERGWNVPSWPAEYGGGGLDKDQERVLREETQRIGTTTTTWSFGTAMLGPVLLEFGNDAQKREHLPGVIHDRVAWCQGYSEPGAGSDLASLQTRAVLDGDEYIINGQKIWTTGATRAEWIFCLVRTDPDVPKHDGISFILFDLKQPGVTISPIQLISGSSDFCQVFFDDVRAKAANLVGKKNGGWTIAKRLLQHERASLSNMGMGAGARRSGGKRKARRYNGTALAAARYLGVSDGTLGDPILRDRVAQHELDQLCYGLTMRRSGAEAKSGKGPSALSSMSKYYASEMAKRGHEIMMSAMGASALGWEGAGFEPSELTQTKAWLRSKGNSIEGGTSEVQLNVIAKRVLGLPD